MSTSFNPGDVVQLKSGGPVMTVGPVKPGPSGQLVTVSWFTESGKLEHSRFLAEALKKVES